MTDEPEDRTELPSLRRRQAAREAGHVARSRDLQVAVWLFAFGGILCLMSHALLATPAAIVRNALEEIEVRSSESVTGADVRSQLASAGGMFLSGFWPVFLILPLVAAAGFWMQHGWLFTPERLAPDFNRLNPASGIGRMASFGEGWRVICKLGLLFGIAWWWSTDWQFIGELVGTNRQAAAINSLTPDRTRDVLTADWLRILELGGQLTLQVAMALLVWGGVDYWRARRAFEQSLMMSPQELRDERTGLDADPTMRQRLAGARRDLATSAVEPPTA